MQYPDHRSDFFGAQHPDPTRIRYPFLDQRFRPEHELSVIYSTLKRVISGDETEPFHCFSEESTVIGAGMPQSDSDRCQVCKIDGCLGCNYFFPPDQRIEDLEEGEEQSTAVKKTTQAESGKIRKRRNKKMTGITLSGLTWFCLKKSRSEDFLGV